MSPTQPEALSNVLVTGKTNQAVLGFPHEEVRRANQLHRVFTPRDEIELCVEYHEGIRQGEDCEALKTQIAAYINYTEATCNHAHFATKFLQNMVREGVLEPKDFELDDIDGDLEEEINEPISCTHIHLEATVPKTHMIHDQEPSSDAPK